MTQDVVTAEHGKWVDRRGDGGRMPFGNGPDIFLFHGVNLFIVALKKKKSQHTQGTGKTESNWVIFLLVILGHLHFKGTEKTIMVVFFFANVVINAKL